MSDVKKMAEMLRHANTAPRPDYFPGMQDSKTLYKKMPRRLPIKPQ
jgi:hypothetical protein